MIVVFIDKLEDFVSFLDRRLMDEVFYEFKEGKTYELTSRKENDIILHFLSKVEEYIVLYETSVNYYKEGKKGTQDEEKFINELQNIFRKVENSIILVKGKIREIYLSYSS
ncbi:MAG: hypothetical protein GF383_12950 [Candidatus Lokiarchaeota archaeon]|nr:hypothetical protein [Candidatus Lokiarchaeota archaeon]MBD3341994.1 hypothetical protein [Candidatus Lokiarchaeota archaeon]